MDFEEAKQVATTDFDSTWLDEQLARYGRDADACIPLLQAVQERHRHLPQEAMRAICERTSITPPQLYGVATFYAQFRLEPVGRHLIKVCKGTACHVSGAQALVESLSEALGVPDGGTTQDMEYTLSAVACLGCCSLAPVLMLDDKTFGKLNRSKAAALVNSKQTAPTQAPKH
ncbi:MAG: NADH-quinone oxidoreductase subunit NuoE [Myxococcota bacterium]|nr:NADH-quinone oxidoreductase subunit NuoE [Myxococcota bacterium]